MLGTTPKEIAEFLMGDERLDKTQIGDYMGGGEKHNLDAMHAYVDLIDFKQTPDFVDGPPPLPLATVFNFSPTLYVLWGSFTSQACSPIHTLYFFGGNVAQTDDVVRNNGKQDCVRSWAASACPGRPKRLTG